jgi:hypothetical protein
VDLHTQSSRLSNRWNRSGREIRQIPRKKIKHGKRIKVDTVYAYPKRKWAKKYSREDRLAYAARYAQSVSAKTFKESLLSRGSNPVPVESESSILTDPPFNRSTTPAINMLDLAKYTTRHISALAQPCQFIPLEFHLAHHNLGVSLELSFTMS